MSKHFCNPCLVAGMVLLLGTCLGCGTRRYEEQLNTSVKQLKQESEWLKMYPERGIRDTPLLVQLPQNGLTENPLDEGVDARRLKPPSIDGAEMLPDRKDTYEGFVEYSGGGKMAFYCHLAATDLSQLGSRDPNRVLRLRLRKAFPDSVEAWKPVPCETPDGLANSWEKIRCTGDQEFYDVGPNGQGTFKRTPGTIEIFTRQVGDFQITIAWRVPTAYVDSVGLAQWAPRVAGSVRVK